LSGKRVVRIHKILIPTSILLASASVTTAASAAPALTTNQACYLVGQRVAITGSGFAASRMYDVAVDGIDFGLGTTDALGGFTASLIPGGLGANIVEKLHVLSATDGTSVTSTRFTVTRTTGARILAGTGTAAKLRVPFQVWGFALVNGKPSPTATSATRVPVFVHYVNPRRKLIMTLALGRTRDPCGYLKSVPKRLFPFAPGRGLWTLQVDSTSSYSKHPTGPVARIRLRVS
jgi:hypothetical protein